MGVGHRQKTDGSIVEQQAVLIANDFRPDPQRIRLAREGELKLQSITAAVP